MAHSNPELDVEPTNEELKALEVEVNAILPQLTGEFDIRQPFGNLVGIDSFDDLTVYN